MWRRSVVLGCGALLSACASGAPAGSRATAAGLADATLRSFAGTWQVSVWDAEGRPIPGHTITAMAGTTGWSQSFPERPNIPVRVLDASGDVVVFEAGPYESVLRPGVRVTALYVTRIEGDRTRGHVLAWYDGGDRAIPVLRGRTEGIRRP